MTAGKSSFGPNIIDTAQIFDGAITAAKMDPALITAMDTALGTYSGIVAQATVTANGGAKQKVGGVLAVGTLIHSCIMYISETWNGSGASLTVGHDGSSQFEYFIPAASFNATAGQVVGNDPSVLGLGLWTPGVQAGTPGFAVTTYGHRIDTYVDPTFDGQTYAYVTKGTGQTTYTGKAVITLFGEQPVGGTL